MTVREGDVESWDGSPGGDTLFRGEALGEAQALSSCRSLKPSKEGSNLLSQKNYSKEVNFWDLMSIESVRIRRLGFHKRVHFTGGRAGSGLQILLEEMPDR